jgi:hypothetical protein
VFSESCSEVSLLLRRGVSSGIKVNDDKTRTSETYLTLNGRNIPFINHVKYFGVIFDKRIN